MTATVRCGSFRCDLCAKSPATTHLTQILDNKLHKVGMCEECAKASGLNEPDFSVAILIKKVLKKLEAIKRSKRGKSTGQIG